MVVQSGALAPLPSSPLESGHRNHADTANLSLLCRKRIAQLGPEDLAELTRFANFRLSVASLPPDGGEDIVQNALLAVLRGSVAGSKGRNPRAQDLVSKPCFNKYLKGVISSLVYTERRRRNTALGPESLEPEADRITSPDCQLSEITTRDVAEQLFERLREDAPVRLRGLVNAWAAQWQDCSKIPLSGQHRRCRTELRRLAAIILKQLTTYPNETYARR